MTCPVFHDLYEPCYTTTQSSPTVFRERDGGDGALVSLEVGHVGALFQVPDLDDGVFSARGEDQTVRVELGAREGRHCQTECGQVVLSQTQHQ